MKIRVMKKRDWKKCLELWQNIPEMGLNSIDDTKEGIVRFCAEIPRHALLQKQTEFLPEQSSRGTTAGVATFTTRRFFPSSEDAELQPHCSKPQWARLKNRESQKSHSSSFQTTKAETHSGKITALQNEATSHTATK